MLPEGSTLERWSILCSKFFDHIEKCYAHTHMLNDVVSPSLLLLPGPLTQIGSTYKGPIYGSNRTVQSIINI